MSADAPLGNTYGICVPTCEHDTQSASFDKWRLQESACRLLPKTRITACHRVISNAAHGVAIRADSKKAWYSGLAVCGSVWTCPVCARKIGEHRRDELQSAVNTAIGQGMGVALITLTFSHGIKDQLSDILPGLAKATRYLKSGRAWQAIKEKYGIRGSVIAKEITHGRNGWHPHTHEIEFFNYHLDAGQRTKLQADIFPLWRAACEKSGLPLPNEEHGVDVRGASQAAHYIGKWGFASELTRSTGKTSWAGRNPWELLADYTLGDRQAGALFIEYAEVFKGRRQLYWSKGLRSLLQIGELFSDEELAECDEFSHEEAVTVTVIDSVTWALICRKKVRGKVLEMAQAEIQQLEGYLDNLRDKVPIRWLVDDLAVNRKMLKATNSQMPLAHLS